MRIKAFFQQWCTLRPWPQRGRNAPSRPMFAVSIAEPFSKTVNSERDAALREICLLEEPARLADNATKLELDGLKMGRSACGWKAPGRPINQLRCASAF